MSRLLLSFLLSQTVAFLDTDSPLSKQYEHFFDEVIMPSRLKLHEMDPLNEKVVAGSDNSSKLEECASFSAKLQTADHKLVILGGGPAGLTAAIYAARAELSPLVISNDAGSQLESTSQIDNFPGFEEGTDAVELVQRMQKQAERFGSKFKSCHVVDVNLHCRPFSLKCSSGDSLKASSIIVATGASARWLGVPGEAELLSKGVHTCATCDGYPYKGRHVAVIGGGDTAMEQALFLARLASKVTIIHRRGSFRASKAMVTRVLHHPNIEVSWNTVVTKFLPAVDGFGSGQSLGSLALSHSDSSETSELFVAGAFVAIGHTPNTKLFADQGVKVSEDGYIVTIPGSTRTSVTGVYAAGDVQDHVYRQAITSAGTGAMAAIDAERWLCENGC